MTDSRWIALRACETLAICPSSREIPMIGCTSRATCSPRALERRAHAVDEERPVVGVGLQHRAERLVAVVVERRVERAHRDRRAAALVREAVRAEHLGGEVLGRDAVGGQPADVGGRERARGVAARGLPRGPAGDRGTRLSRPRSPPRGSRRVNLAQALFERLELRRGSAAGSWSPNCARCACVWSSSARASSRSTLSASATRVAVEPVELAGARAPGRSRSASRRPRASPSQRRKIQASTREFSPKPGHRNLPSSSLRNQLTWKILRQLGALALAELRASARSSRPCCSRRTAASRTGRSAARRPCRPRPRSSRSSSSRRGRRRAPSRTPRARAARRIERRPPNRNASIGTPFGSSHSSAIDGHWRGGRREAGVRVRGRASSDVRRPVVALPVDQVVRASRRSCPPTRCRRRRSSRSW